jgi:hypothetical protein
MPRHKEGQTMNRYPTAVLAFVILFATAAVLAGEETAGQETAAEQPEPTTEELMDDAQARGLEAASQDETETATNWFTKAAEYADRIASWEGLMDASLALSSIGDADASKAILDKANALSQKFNDWRTSLSVGYAYANLPDEADAEDEAEAAIDDAKDLASNLDSWRAMVEVGTAYLSLKIDEAKTYATDAYDKALAIASEASDAEGLETVAMRLDEIGEEAKAAQAREIIKELPPDETKKRRVRPPTPPGWSPTGKTLAEPREISEESRAILADRAARKHAEAAARALEAGDVDDQVYYVYEYNRYWASHPDQFFQRVWDLDEDFDVPGWARHHLSQYRLVNGIYVRITSD